MSWFGRFSVVAISGLAVCTVLSGCGVEVVDEEGGAGGAGTSDGQGSHDTTSGSSTSSSGMSEECGPSSVDTDDPCETCAAIQCMDEALACCNTPGCLDIIDCGREKGCSGIDCYADDKCKDVIDGAGGLGDATNNAMILADCSAMSCPDECGL
ncbi:MAG: hypothetical protein JRI68_17835 [Deltaproteobacteria bacterium]|nr:hypothetical protein [Deltaproteobacteria bacterium]